MKKYGTIPRVGFQIFFFIRYIYYPKISKWGPPSIQLEHAPTLHEHPHLVTQQVTYFNEIILDLDVVHEDILIGIFIHSTLNDYALKWFHQSSPNDIS